MNKLCLLLIAYAGTNMCSSQHATPKPSADEHACAVALIALRVISPVKAWVRRQPSAFERYKTWLKQQCKKIALAVLFMPLALFAAKPAKKPVWSQETLLRVVAMQQIYDHASPGAQSCAHQACFATYSSLIRYGNPQYRALQEWLARDLDLLKQTFLELGEIIKDAETSKQFAAAVKKTYNSPNIIL